MNSVRQLDQSYNNEMLRILESSPMVTNNLDLHFDKSPDIFSATKLWSDNFKYYGVFVDEKLAGFGMYLIYKGYVGGQLHDIIYVGNFCIDKQQRKKGLIILLTEFILSELKKEGHFVFCMILQGNKAAERYFNERNPTIPSLPSGRIILAYEARSILILGSKKPERGFTVKTANHEDTDLINEFIQSEYQPGFLSPLYSKDWFEERIIKRPNLNFEDYYLAFKGKDLVGICAAWEMSALKRTRILKYKGGFKIVRLLYSLLSKIFRYTDLPEEGNAIKEIFITDVIISGQDYRILKALLKSIYRDYRERKYHIINIGSYQNDPLLKAIQPFFSRTLKSNIYFSSNNLKNLIDSNVELAKPFVDIALI